MTARVLIASFLTLSFVGCDTAADDDGGGEGGQVELVAPCDFSVFGARAVSEYDRATIDFSMGQVTRINGVACEYFAAGSRSDTFCADKYRCGSDGCLLQFSYSTEDRRGSIYRTAEWSLSDLDQITDADQERFTAEAEQFRQICERTLDTEIPPLIGQRVNLDDQDSTPDPDPADECRQNGGQIAANGACVVLNCRQCPRGQSCGDGPLAFCGFDECDRDSDCPENWECQERCRSSDCGAICKIGCRTDSDGRQSAECPAGMQCYVSSLTDQGGCILIEGGSSSACSNCLSSCRGLPSCCQGEGCICQGACGG